jgi:hypothetical protein
MGLFDGQPGRLTVACGSRNEYDSHPTRYMFILHLLSISPCTEDVSTYLLHL